VLFCLNVCSVVTRFSIPCTVCVTHVTNSALCAVNLPSRAAWLHTRICPWKFALLKSWIKVIPAWGNFKVIDATNRCGACATYLRPLQLSPSSNL
jgi:hypothetical protein